MSLTSAKSTTSEEELATAGEADKNGLKTGIIGQLPGKSQTQVIKDGTGFSDDDDDTETEISSEYDSDIEIHGSVSQAMAKAAKSHPKPTKSKTEMEIIQKLHQDRIKKIGYFRGLKPPTVEVPKTPPRLPSTPRRREPKVKKIQAIYNNPAPQPQNHVQATVLSGPIVQFRLQGGQIVPYRPVIAHGSSMLLRPMGTLATRSPVIHLPVVTNNTGLPPPPTLRLTAPLAASALPKMPPNPRKDPGYELMFEPISSNDDNQ